MEKYIDRETVYQNHIRPLILLCHQENQKALDQAVSDLETCFRGYEAGIDAFVDDMTGLGSRLKMVGRQFQGWWEKIWNGVDTQRVAQSVRESFERHVYSENRIRGDIENIMITVAYALNANQNLMISRIQEIVRNTESGIDPGQFVMSSYNQALHHTWNVSFDGMGKKALINLAQSLTIDILGSWSAIWRFLPPRYAAPISLILTLVMDYWNTKRLENNLKDECRQMVQHTRDAILHNVAKGVIPRMNREIENLYKANLETTETLVAGNSFNQFMLMLSRIFRM